MCHDPVGTFPTVTGERQSLRRSRGEQTDETTTLQSCPECSGSLVADSDNGETVCEECGLVVDENNIDHGPEWRAFEAAEKEKKSRVGAPTTKMLHDDGLTTTISWQDKDAYGTSLGEEKRMRMERLRTWQNRIRTKNPGERNLQYALGEINRMASAVGVPDSVQEVAAVIYRRALEDDLIRGRSIESVATACLYAACRKEGFPRSLDELTAISRVDKKEVGRTYRHIAQELGLEIGPTDPKQYVPRFCSDLGVSEEIELKATEILDAAAEQNIFSGRSPPGLAGAAIYAATVLCNDKRPQHEVAEVADVTVVTIRNRYQEQMEAMEDRLVACCCP